MNIHDEDIQFLLIATEAYVGGHPAIKLHESGNFSVIPMCGCEECQHFRANYEPKESDTIPGALRMYASGRIEYAEATVASQQVTVKH